MKISLLNIDIVKKFPYLMTFPHESNEILFFQIKIIVQFLDQF